jgi:beta-lactamase superfamily II metal-dependent hydrolase
MCRGYCLDLVDEKWASGFVVSMAGVHTLNSAEIGMIKTMLTLSPRLSNQAILAYFTRPGRDLNHRLIAEIAAASYPSIKPAPIVATIAFMAAYSLLTYPKADQFINLSSPGSSQALLVFASLELHWWPVGQGLFHSGRLKSLVGDRFSWVYDCGSHSGAMVRDAAITHYRTANANRRINLVTLSHFDSDHIDGITALIEGVRVDSLLLPYLPLWQRLLIAISEGIQPTDPAFAFLMDPAGFLDGLENSDIGEIVFVPAAGPDDIGAPGGEEPGPGPDVPIEGAKIEEGKPPPDFDDDPVACGPASGKVRFLRQGGRIVVPSLWEFVPYNDAEMQPYVTAQFIKRAARVARHFVAKPPRRDTALKLLKRIYDKTFGASSTRRNLVSLFLYSGPVGNRICLDQLAASAEVKLNDSRDNFAQLSTGDGYVDDSARLSALRKFYANDRRFDRAGIVQVMHHGASGNWHDGVAAAFEPAVSIFSSDPERKKPGHPHADVLRDFWTGCWVRHAVTSYGREQG